MHLYQLIYLSKATRSMSLRETMSIVDSAQERNRDKGITGVLCGGGGYFMQVLEGEHGAVSETFSRIMRDSRHDDLRLIDFSLVRSRTFGDWSMKLINLDPPDREPTMKHRPKIMADDATHPFFTTDPRIAFAFLYSLKHA